MLARALFDGDVLLAEADPATYRTELHPDEQAQIAPAVEKRQREYATGRGLARSMLAAHGHPTHALLNDSDRVPAWPEGWLGSISHTRGYCGVALAHAHSHRGLGLDVEQAEPLEAKLFRSILRDEELAELVALPDREAGLRAKLAFSAKEAAYKAQYALSRAYLGFSAMRIELDERLGSDPASQGVAEFRAVFAKPAADVFAPGDVLHGRFRFAEGLVLCGVEIRAS